MDRLIIYCDERRRGAGKILRRDVLLSTSISLPVAMALISTTGVTFVSINDFHGLRCHYAVELDAFIQDNL